MLYIFNVWKTTIHPSIHYHLYYTEFSLLCHVSVRLCIQHLIVCLWGLNNISHSILPM